ncbi:uncharacterized protein N7503_004998 [Penicillium pulvis]|uniref:uncharacterized protein n=1 Tax=Penicillium pulvis TaxID=1562058 RepID=UPI0025499890|nr:uncharacterized protein N7503_004998 [Penicillium pulvis]KAJ5802548.1 hypothetical protein N7503_004998 [Penicillium pulvis]
MLFSSQSSWGAAMVASLLAATVYAIPIRDSSTETQNRLHSKIQPRNPRIIPDTENYLSSIFHQLGIDTIDKALAPTSSTADTTETPAPSSEASHGVDEEATATPTAAIAEETSTPSSTTTADEVTFTTTIRNGNNNPIENIQIGQGWKGSNRIHASDVPVIMSAVEEALANRFNDIVDSSDELGLE